MNQDLWTQVDSYFADRLMPADSILDQAQESAAQAGLPAISVAANQGKMLMLLARMCGAKRILEIGTLAAYSTLWLARALPKGGMLTTIEADPAHAAIARANIAAAGLTECIQLQEGKALDVLPALSGPFDFVFIDADKINNPAYFDWAVKLGRPGTTVCVDNVVRNGAILDPLAEDKVRGCRNLAEMLRNDPRVDATAVQTVGSKGWDGFILAVVN